MNTIKIKLSTSGRIAALDKNFPLYCGQFNNVLLNILVPTAILSGGFEVGQVENTLDPTNAADEIALNTLLTAYIKTFTGDETRPHAGDVVFYIYNNAGVLTYYTATFNGATWDFTAVDNFNFGAAGANVKIGMIGTFPNGVVFKSKSYYTRFVKKFTNEGVEYALYETQMPKDFTEVVGDQTLVINVENIAGDNITNIVTSQTATLPILRSTVLDRDEAVEASELARLEADMNTLAEDMQRKQDKQDNDIQFTTEKTVVGALNNLNTRENSTAATASAADARSVENAGKIATLESVVGAGEYYVGTMTVTTDVLPLPNPTNALNYYVQAQEGRAPKGGDTVIIIQKITDQLDKNYKAIFNGTNWIWYEIPPMELAGNGSAGIVEGTYTVGATANTIVDITGGKIVAIYVKDTNGNYQDIRDYANTLNTTIADIIAGNTQVGVALRALQDGLGNNIVNTYMTQTAGATKQYVKDYAMPKEFNNAFVIKKVDGNVVLSEDLQMGLSEQVNLEAVDAPIGETLLGRAVYTLGDVKFQLSTKNSFSGCYYLLRSATSTENVYLKIQTYYKKSGTPYLINTEIAAVNFGAINTATITVSGNFTGIGDGGSISLTTGDEIYQEFIIIREASTAMTYTLTSGIILSSKFWLNTGVQTVTYRESEIGENIYVDLSALTPTVDGNGDIHFATTDSELTRAVSSGTRSDAIFTLPDFTGVSGVTANSKIYVSTNAGLTEFAFASAANSPAKLADFAALIRPNGKAILWGTYFPATNVFEVDIPNEKSLEFVTGTITLEAVSWVGSAPSSITYYLTGLGDNMVIFAPHSNSDRIRADAIGLRLVEAYHATGNVSFYANHAAAMDITLDYIIVKNTGVNKAFLLPNETYATNFSGTAVLEAAEWVGTSYSLTIDGLQNSDMIDLCGESKTDDENYADSGIWVNPSHSGGVVTFVADTAPTVDIYIKYFVTRGR